MTPDEKLAERFWRKVNRCVADECWNWLGAKTGNGYGAFKAHGKTMPAHRFSYEVGCANIPVNALVCHHCDNPICVNPKHLFIGTHGDNMRDMRSKNRNITGDKHFSRLFPERLARGDRHGLRLHPECVARGERNGNAKLDSDDVRKIRKAIADGGASQRDIAKRFNVTKHVVSKIKLLKSWRHVQ